MSSARVYLRGRKQHSANTLLLYLFDFSGIVALPEFFYFWLLFSLLPTADNKHLHFLFLKLENMPFSFVL